ncbi:MAG: acyltransferase [Bacteroidota bacterium]
MKKIIKYVFSLPAIIGNAITLALAKAEHGTYSFHGAVHIHNKNGKLRFGNNLQIISGRYGNPIGGDTKMLIRIGPGALLEIGNNVSMSNSAIVCRAGISIADNVMIGGSCKIWDTDFHPIDPAQRLLTPDQNYKSKPISIERNAFIGSGCYILKGVTVGENSVIGAGSVVTKNIPANEIWAGNPAKFIRYLTETA